MANRATTPIFDGGLIFQPIDFANMQTYAVGNAAQARLRYNNATGFLQVSINGAAYTNISTAAASTLGAAVNAGNVVNSVNANGQITWTTGSTWSAAAPQIFGPSDTGMFITAGAPAAQGQAMSIKAGDSTTAVNAGGASTLTGGTGGANGDGGAVQLIGGRAGSATGTGGAITLDPGYAQGTGAAGNINLTGRAGVGFNNLGTAIVLTGGQSVGSSAGGGITGTAGSAGATGTGGVVTWTGGAGVAGAGGLVSLVGGAGVGTDKAAGGVTVSTGNSSGTGLAVISFVAPPTSATGITTNAAVEIAKFVKTAGGVSALTGIYNFVQNATGGALATNAIDGFLHVGNCAGVPTGTPTAFTGASPLVVDTTNNNFYVYSTGAWRNVSAGTTPTWATVLAAGNTSGATNAIISVGQGIGFRGVPPGADQIKTDATLTIFSTAPSLGGPTLTIAGGTASVAINAANSVNGVSHFGVTGQTTSTSGTLNSINFAPSFADLGATSSTTMRCLYLNPTYNYTGVSRTGSNTDLQIDRVETSLATGAQNFIVCRAGSVGTTDKFLVNNAGRVSAVSHLAGTTGTVFGWTASATDPTAALDTGLSRTAAGRVAFGTGAAASVAGEWISTNGYWSNNLIGGSGAAFGWTNNASPILGTIDTYFSRTVAGRTSLIDASGAAEAVLTLGVLTATQSDGVYGWTASATASSGALDTGISRLGAASLAIGNGSAGDSTGSLQLTTLRSINGSGAQAGTTLALVSGNGGTSLGAGAITLTTGSVTDGVGGNITCVITTATGTNRAGGAYSFTGGNATGSAAAGGITMTAGQSVTGTAGAFTATAGQGGSTSGAGGVVFIRGGAGAAGNAAGGASEFIGGAGQGSDVGGYSAVRGGAGGATGAGGVGYLLGGTGGATSGDSGGITIQPGTVTSGNAGSYSFNGIAGVGGNSTGSSFNLACGNSVGSGVGGSFILTAGQSVTGLAGGITFTAGQGGSTSGAGGIASLIGGAGAAGNAAGGISRAVGGAGQGSAAGGDFQGTGGLAGATGIGGAATVTGGAGVAGAGGLCSAVGGAGVGTDKNSGGLTLSTGLSTGTGTAQIAMQTGYALATGTTTQTAYDRDLKTSKSFNSATPGTSGTVLNFCNMALATSVSGGGCIVDYLVEVNDGTAASSIMGWMQVAAENRAGTVLATASMAAATNQTIQNSATFTTLACTTTATVTGTNVLLKVTPTWVAGTPTVVRVTYQVRGNGRVTFAPQ